MQRFFMLFLAVTCSAVGPHTGWAAALKPSGVSWAFNITHTDADGTPHTRVSLRIGARRVLIAPDIEEQFSLVPRQEYKERRIPSAAVAACTGWWAGQGDDFYVIRRHGHWEAFRRELDEQAAIPAYRLIRIIPLR